jgi:hypothetical protein
MPRIIQPMERMERGPRDLQKHQAQLVRRQEESPEDAQVKHGDYCACGGSGVHVGVRRKGMHGFGVLEVEQEE